MAKTPGLLESAAALLGCQYLSDLHYLIPCQYGDLADYIAQCSPEQHSLFEWNDALEYLTGIEAQRSIDIAKDTLVGALRAKALGTIKPAVQ